MGKVILNDKLISSLFHKAKLSIVIKYKEREDLVKFNEILDELTVNKFFEYYSELRDYYQYLATKYRTLWILSPVKYVQGFLTASEAQ